MRESHNEISNIGDFYFKEICPKVELSLIHDNSSKTFDCGAGFYITDFAYTDSQGKTKRKVLYSIKSVSVELGFCRTTVCDYLNAIPSVRIGTYKFSDPTEILQAIKKIKNPSPRQTSILKFFEFESLAEKNAQLVSIKDFKPYFTYKLCKKNGLCGIKLPERFLRPRSLKPKESSNKINVSKHSNTELHEHNSNIMCKFEEEIRLHKSYIKKLETQMNVQKEFEAAKEQVHKAKAILEESIKKEKAFENKLKSIDKEKQEIGLQFQKSSCDANIINESCAANTTNERKVSIVTRLKQKEFANRILEGKSAAEAYILSFNPTKTNRDSARSLASRVMKDPYVKELIESGLKSSANETSNNKDSEALQRSRLLEKENSELKRQVALLKDRIGEGENFKTAANFPNKAKYFKFSSGRSETDLNRNIGTALRVISTKFKFEVKDKPDERVQEGAYPVIRWSVNSMQKLTEYLEAKSVNDATKYLIEFLKPEWKPSGNPYKPIMDKQFAQAGFNL